jgi:hypothetical protein
MARTGSDGLSAIFYTGCSIVFSRLPQEDTQEYYYLPINLLALPTTLAPLLPICTPERDYRPESIALTTSISNT